MHIFESAFSRGVKSNVFEEQGSMVFQIIIQIERWNCDYLASWGPSEVIFFHFQVSFLAKRQVALNTLSYVIRFKFYTTDDNS